MIILRITCCFGIQYDCSSTSIALIHIILIISNDVECIHSLDIHKHCGLFFLSVYELLYKRKVYFITGCLHLDYPVSCPVQLCIFYQPCGTKEPTLCHLAVPCATLRYLVVFSMTVEVSIFILNLNCSKFVFYLFAVTCLHISWANKDKTDKTLNWA